MQVDTFFKLSDEFLEESRQIQLEKGREYCIDDGSGKVDKFANFRSIGARLNLDPKIVMLVYMLKHMDSLRTYALYEQEGSEGVKGRCQDLVNYAVMFWAMDHEDKAFAELSFVDANDTYDKIKESWDDIVTKISLKAPSMSAVLADCDLSGFSHKEGYSALYIETASGVRNDTRIELERIVSDVTGTNIKIYIRSNNKVFDKMIETFDNEILR
jgi:hypothetical protein